MSRTNFASFLLLAWKLSTLFILPVIIYFYLMVMASYIDNFSFQQVLIFINGALWVFICSICYSGKVLTNKLAITLKSLNIPDVIIS